jgi:hypothetical protein
MPNCVDNDPRRVQPVINHIGVRSRHGARNIALVGKPPGIGVVREQINNGLESSLDIFGALR